MSENKDYSRILALALTQVLPIAKRAVEADNAKAEATEEAIAAIVGDDVESDAQLIEISAGYTAVNLDEVRIHRGEEALRQFNTTDKSVVGLGESALDGEFNIEFEL
ncbi:hypothetical protein [Xanthomonas phage RTH11]|nr:hypothetical protein [Xanthomonas phage RTH11]